MFFLTQMIIVVVGAIVHILLDHKANRRTQRRVVELLLIWLLGAGGVMAIVAGIGHIGPNSAEVAEGIGYRSSMFQWEIGWADIAIGVAGLGCIWRRNGWLTCATTVLAISYWGDAIGHIMQYSANGNTAPNNVWAIPSDILQPFLVIGLLIAYRITDRDLSLSAKAQPEADAVRLKATVLAEAAATEEHKRR